MNILKADLFYMLRDKTIRVLFILAAFLPILSAVLAYKFSGSIGVTFEGIAVQSESADIMGALLGIGMASFFGHDFANNTIRNKICYGETRTKVTLLSFFESAMITILMIAVSLGFSYIATSFAGNMELGSEFWEKYLCQAGILLSFSFVITALTLCTQNSKPGIFTTLIMTVFVGAAAQMLPLLAKRVEWARYVSRCLYLSVSNMLMKSSEGIYTASEGLTYDKIYLNALLIFAVYSIASVVLTLIVVRKQSYK